MVFLKNPLRGEATNTLYLDKKLADVNFFIVAENERITAHKMVLANASSVFRTMFYEKPGKKADEIKIVDSSAAAVTEFLRCIYASQLELTAETIADVMGLAHKYDVAECIAFCKQFLNEHLPEDYFFLGFELAVRFKSTELKNKFGQKIADQPSTVFESQEFIDCSQDVLKNILELKFLLCDPKEVFDACMEWSENACEKKNQRLTMKNRRQRLGNCLFLIPFRQMTHQQISECMKECKGLFNQKELEELVTIITSDEETAVTISLFGTNASAQYEKSVWVCPYAKVVESQKYWLKNTEISKLRTANTTMCQILSAIDLLDVRHNQPTAKETDNRQTLSGTMSIVKQTKNGRQVLLKQHIAIIAFGCGGDRQSIKLIEPIVIEDVEKYEIQFNFDSSWTARTFYAVIPQAQKIRETGIIERLFYCCSN